MLDTLPEHLSERTRVVNEGDSEGRFVVYWMRNAVRIDENPALDVAKHFAVELKLPLLVYHALSEHYRYASDRHHTFILEGARDVQKQCVQAGISYAFHLATPLDRQSHLLSLAPSAAVVVTEDMPVDPARRFLNRLLEQTETLTCCVDTACVVPMQLVGKAHTRAFKFRSATKKLYQERLTRSWPDCDIQAQAYRGDLPFNPIDLQVVDLSALITACEIDHSAGPVLGTMGGSVAGYERWERFKENGLSRYARQRNNALLDGVSRMSAYLHYGMVSPMRIARESANFDNAGSEKYLDELLIWRELAYGFCFYREDHDSWNAIPDWAQATLLDHASDDRQEIYSWEQLARGRTDDPLWNAAQTSLLIQGELHNNVRMTWGKAILNWVECPKRALQMIFDLNHRYALDGRDPCSFGGILWCLGQFDRPFTPEKKIIGTVRPRPTKDHARRLDPQKYAGKVASSPFDPVPHVAVIGAGLSGLFAARTLCDHGVNVTVFEKSRGLGGRMATRRVDGQSRFDHGAQYFTARDHRFQRYVDSWLQQGVVARWPDQEKLVVLKDGTIEKESSPQHRHVGTPTMNAICKHLGGGLQIQKQTRVEKVQQHENHRLQLIDDSGKELGQYDRLVISAPAGQTAELLAGLSPLAEVASSIDMCRCWAAMVSFDVFEKHDWAGAFVHDSFIVWIARNDSKPGRPFGSADFVIHTDHEFAVENWDLPNEQVAEKIVSEFWRVTGFAELPPAFTTAHRWKFARSTAPLEAALGMERRFDSAHGIAICGDWLRGDRVEGAFLSGMDAAGVILGSLMNR